MAYEPILQAALEYKPRGFLPGTYGILRNKTQIDFAFFPAQ